MSGGTIDARGQSTGGGSTSPGKGGGAGSSRVRTTWSWTGAFAISPSAAATSAIVENRSWGRLASIRRQAALQAWNRANFWPQFAGRPRLDVENLGNDRDDRAAKGASPVSSWYSMTPRA